MNIFDVTIIGGGPAGLYSAFYSGLRGLKTKIIEFQHVLGGKVHIYPEKMLWDVGGQPPILARDFIENLIQQGLTFSPTVCLNTKVEHIQKQDDVFVIHTASGEIHYSKTVIMANGGGIISPQKLKLDGATKFEMTNLHYTVQRLAKFKDQRLLISGGGNSAIDWAVELLLVAKEITVIYRKEELSAHEAQIDKLKAHGVEILVNTEIETLIANNEKTAIQQVVVLQNGKRKTIEVDAVLINHGYNRDASLTFDAPIQPELVDDYYLKGAPNNTTTIDGLFAAGDIISHEGKVNLLVGAFQDAVNAVNSAKQYLDPKAYKVAMVSSHNDIFTERNQALLKKMI